MGKLNAYLFKQVDNTPLVLWRIIFGLVLFFETAGAIAVGWVDEVYIDPPEFTFTFIGFEWLQPLSGNGMYIYFGLLAFLSIGIILGYRYKLSMLLFTIGWLGVYFMHKTSYNNHHYLMSLLCVMMALLPAHRDRSMDARAGRVERQNSMYNYCLQLFVGLFLIVFVYASVAKMYPDWMQGTPLNVWLANKKYSLTGLLFSSSTKGLIMSWGGIVFDLLIIPALIWKRTRNAAFFASVFFHVTNSITFQIGTFPYMMIGACVLFYPPSSLKRIFRLKEHQSYSSLAPVPRFKGLIAFSFITFITVQVLLPLRHYAIPGNVFWTEEGHRLSWRMMLRSKRGSAAFKVIHSDGTEIRVNARKDMTPKQYATMSTHPDMIWQYCQFLKERHGSDIRIYVSNNVSLNFRDVRKMIDEDYDMAKAEWHLFQHEEWITKGPEWSDR